MPRTPPNQPPPRRRTQAERSDAMRKRLLEATLESLAEDGYAGTTLSSVVRRAGVSRGAQVHHYPNKQALILDATEDLLRRTYKTLGTLLLAIADEDNRLEGLIEAAWDELFSIPLYRAFLELLLASQRDTALADAMRQQSARLMGMFGNAIEHYFGNAPGSHEDVGALFMQIQWLLAGMASQAHLLGGRRYLRAHLRLLAAQMSRHIRARRGVTRPPPRPEAWNRPAADLANAPSTATRGRRTARPGRQSSGRR
jgi:AcrR family transcriptional regulator